MPWRRSCGLVLSLSTVLALSPAFVVRAQTPAPAKATPAVATTAPAPTAAPADPLQVQVEKAIEVNRHRYLIANHNSPWQIFHGVLAYRQDFTLQVGAARQSAIEWIATADARYHNRPWILVTPHGAKFHPYSGTPKAFEGHPSQSLALLSESRLPLDFKFKVSGREVTLADMLQNTMMEVNTREETTWVLWALINYMPVDKQWVNQHGEAWSIERLVQLEVAADTPNRPCGGNHNLFVLCRARDKYLKTGLPLRGVWLEADQKLKTYMEYARSMQNRDGTFSSNFYKGSGYSNQMDARFNTTGHTLEFLSIALPDQRLNEQWVRNAVNILSYELIQTKQQSPDPGPLYHSLNSLMNYRDRVWPKPVLAEVAQAPTPPVADPGPSTPSGETKADTTKTAVPTAPALLSPGVVKVAKPAATISTATEAPAPTTADLSAPRLPEQPASKVAEAPVSALEPVNR